MNKTKKSCNTWCVFLTILLTLAVAALGCGKEKRHLAQVTGKVTYQGKPLASGAVMFQPESGQFAVGEIQPDGTFEMVTGSEGKGAVVGKNGVRINCFEKPADGKPRGEPRGEMPMGKSLIPQKYTSYATSGITVDVKPGVNEPVMLELK
jgi:hypothetical protein